MKSCNRSIAFVGWNLLLLVVALQGAAFAGNDRDNDRRERAKTLYVWAGDQARLAPDFLAVIDFDEESKDFGKVLRTGPIPPPGNVSNEAHHCHLSADNKIRDCGGLLSLLRGQNGIFFFDVSDARHPKFLFSASTSQSSTPTIFCPWKTADF